ncbi:MAG: DNA polymerase III subunit beta [Bacillota bacterium]|jgi:DNA polymerase-3 subunit beta
MRFQCMQEDLSRALQVVSRAVATRSTLQALSGIYFELSGTRLRCLGSDLEIGIETYIPVTAVEGSGSFVLPGKTIADLVRKLSAEIVEIEISDTANQGIIKAGKSVFHLNMLPAADYPPNPTPKEETSWTLTDLFLRDAIRRTTFATLPNDSRPFLSSILFELEGNRFRAVATDVSRLAVQEGTLETTVENKISVMIPVRAMQEVFKLLSGTEDELVEIAVSERQIMFRCREANLYSRLITGQFPQYEQVIPKSSATTVIIDKNDLASALDRVSLFVSSIRMTLSQGGVHINATGPEVGDAYEEIEASVEGPELEIGFNAKFLIDFLKATECETVRIRFNGPRTPVLMDAEDDEKYLYVVMPLLLSE